ncbi:hypothetical protein [Pedobacter foliorum]|uniref:hypothetical protein n=1 Tax=Pedobacter foliorum TaxID=2739058 RepID=UPI001563A9DB|nr:hypothetical protein [Pedobacter foliorum]NRF39876.1 hypothetical protein [Pedobacter foliorum]
MCKLSSVFLMVIIFVQYGCRSYTFSKGGRVESNFMTYYFNDSLKVGAVLYGNMPLDTANSGIGTSLTNLHHLDKEVLKKFHINKSDALLFSFKGKDNATCSVIGLVRNSSAMQLSDYKNAKEGQTFFLVKTIQYKNRDAYEGLIRIDQNRFLSIIYYLPSEKATGRVEEFNTIMLYSAKRIKEGQSMLSVLNVFEDAEELFSDHGYLTPFKLIERRGNYGVSNFTDQALATYYSFCGDLDLANKASEAFMGIKKENLDAKDLAPAAARILSQTVNKQVVMFNTAHHVPQHAYFLGELLDRLYKQGFTYLALEGLGDTSTVMKNGFVSFNDGIYIRDPVFSNLVCKARAIGFKIIGYDTDSDDREEGQVQNIVDQSLKLNKDSRVVVLAGYAHIQENSTPKKMAAFFKEMTGIDPLTIDQTTLMTSSCKSLETNNMEDVFLYSGEDLKTGTDLVIWNNINMQNKPIGFPATGEVKGIKIDIPDLSSKKDSVAAFSIYNHANYVIDSTVTPIFVKVIPTKKNTFPIKIGRGKYLVKCLGYDKRLLYKVELIVN